MLALADLNPCPLAMWAATSGDRPMRPNVAVGSSDANAALKPARSAANCAETRVGSTARFEEGVNAMNLRKWIGGALLALSLVLNPIALASAAELELVPSSEAVKCVNQGNIASNKEALTEAEPLVIFSVMDSEASALFYPALAAEGFDWGPIKAEDVKYIAIARKEGEAVYILGAFDAEQCSLGAGSLRSETFNAAMKRLGTPS